MMNTIKTIPKLIILFTVLLSIIFIVMAYNCYPVPDGDSVWLIPFSISKSQGKGFISPFQYWITPEGKGLVYFMYYWLLGNFSNFESFPLILLLISFINIISLWLLLTFIWDEISRLKTHKIVKSLIVCIPLLVTSTFLIGIGARPEGFIFFLTMVAFCNTKFGKPRFQWQINSSVLAIAFFTHPLESGFLGLSLAIYFALKYNVKKALSYTFSSYLLCLLLTWCLLHLYPDGIQSWLKLLKTSSNVVSARLRVKATYMQWWILNPANSFFGFIYILGFFGFPKFIKKKATSDASIKYIIFNITVLIICIFSFKLYEPICHNYAMVLLPFVLLSILNFIADIIEWKFSTYMKLPILLFMLSIVSLGSIGFIREVILFPYFYKYSVSYTKARNNLSYIRNKYNKKIISLTTSFFGLTENYYNLSKPCTCLFENNKTTIVNHMGNPTKVGDILLLQQVNIPYPNKGIPPEVKGFKLIKNKFVNYKPRILGIKFANSPRGYNYALYFSNSFYSQCKKNELDRLKQKLE